MLSAVSPISQHLKSPLFTQSFPALTLDGPSFLGAQERHQGVESQDQPLTEDHCLLML